METKRYLVVQSRPCSESQQWISHSLYQAAKAYSRNSVKQHLRPIDQWISPTLSQPPSQRAHTHHNNNSSNNNNSNNNDNNNHDDDNNNNNKKNNGTF